MSLTSRACGGIVFAALCGQGAVAQTEGFPSAFRIDALIETRTLGSGSKYSPVETKRVDDHHMSFQGDASRLVSQSAIAQYCNLGQIPDDVGTLGSSKAYRAVMTYYYDKPFQQSWSCSSESVTGTGSMQTSVAVQGNTIQFTARGQFAGDFTGSRVLKETEQVAIVEFTAKGCKVKSYRSVQTQYWDGERQTLYTAKPGPKTRCVLI